MELILAKVVLVEVMVTLVTKDVGGDSNFW